MKQICDMYSTIVNHLSSEPFTIKKSKHGKYIFQNLHCHFHDIFELHNYFKYIHIQDVSKFDSNIEILQKRSQFRGIKHHEFPKYVILFEYSF